MTQPWDLQPIKDIMVEYDIRFATAETSAPRAWVERGMDIHLDILPVLKRMLTSAKKQGTRIGSYRYFTEAILKEHDIRMNAAERLKVDDPDADKRRAKNISWARDRQIKCVGIGPADFRWLEEYEQQHGKVMA